MVWHYSITFPTVSVCFPAFRTLSLISNLSCKFSMQLSHLHIFPPDIRLESLHLRAFILVRLTSPLSWPFLQCHRRLFQNQAPLCSHCHSHWLAPKKYTVLSRADHDGWVGEFFGRREYPLLWKEGEVYLLPLSEEDIGFYKAPGESAQIMVRISAHPFCDGSASPRWATKQGGCHSLRAP